MMCFLTNVVLSISVYTWTRGSTEFSCITLLQNIYCCGPTTNQELMCKYHEYHKDTTYVKNMMFIQEEKKKTI